MTFEVIQMVQYTYKSRIVDCMGECGVARDIEAKMRNIGAITWECQALMLISGPIGPTDPESRLGK